MSKNVVHPILISSIGIFLDLSKQPPCPPPLPANRIVYINGFYDSKLFTCGVHLVGASYYQDDKNNK